MTFSEIHRVLETRMATWAGGYPVDWPGVPPSAVLQRARSEMSPWVRLTIRHGDSATACIGDTPAERHPGVVLLQVFVAEGEGMRPATQIADSLAEHFRYFQQGHLATQAASLTHVDPANGWQQVNLTIPFRAG